MKTRFLMMLGAAAALASWVPATPAAAAMDMSTVDCTKAAMMMSPDAMMAGDHAMASPAPAMTMSTDDAFNDHMHTMMMHATMMAGMELKCGKDPKARAMAAKLLQQLNDDGSADAMSILNTYNH